MTKETRKEASDLRRTLEETQSRRREARPRSERRAAQRLRELPRSLICPLCKLPKPSTKQWVALGNGTAICLSCYRQAKK